MPEINKKAAARVWGASPAGAVHGGGAMPGTKEFFENVIRKRSNYELTWIIELVPFSSFRSMSVLEIGCGAGYDAYEFCRNGAYYVGLDIAPENPKRTNQHLAFYNLRPLVVVGDAENLVFPAESFNVAFSNGVLHHAPDIDRCFQEAHRVLRRGGVFWVVVYHQNSIFYWVTLYLFDHILGLGFLRRSLKERLAMIEYTTGHERPLVTVYSARALRRRLQDAGFEIEATWIRKLVKEDFPQLPGARRLLQNVPQAWLDRLGKVWGWYVIAKATKP